MISSQGVHDTFIYNMDKFCILIVIWSIDIWDDVHILVRALNCLSGEPPHWDGGCSIPYIPPFPYKGKLAHNLTSSYLVFVTWPVDMVKNIWRTIQK